MEWINFICENCEHAKGFPIGCEAFPDMIPEIIMKTNKHSKPIKGQGNDLVYTPIEK